jgi:hypothetical protein
VSIFHRDHDKSEQIQASVERSPLPDMPPPLKVASISLSPLQEATLSHALHRKVSRILMDSSQDGDEFADTSAGPIV